MLRAPAEQTKVATVLGIGPSVLRAPAEQTKVAPVLGIGPSGVRAPAVSTQVATILVRAECVRQRSALRWPLF